MIAQADNIIEQPSTRLSDRPLKSQQETFCQLVANDDISNTEAYKQSGYAHKGAGQNAGRLIKNDYIIRRISYIRAERAVKDGITQEKQAIKLEKAQALALADGDTSTYIRAVVEQSKHYGLSIDKQQTESTDAQRLLEAKDKVLADKLAKQMLDNELGAKTGVLEDSHGL